MNQSRNNLIALKNSLNQDPKFVNDNWNVCYPLVQISEQLGLFIKYTNINNPTPAIFNQLVAPNEQTAHYQAGIIWGHLIDEICRNFISILKKATGQKYYMCSTYEPLTNFDPCNDWMLFSNTPITDIADCTSLTPLQLSWHLPKMEAYRFLINIYLKLFEILMECPFYSDNLYNHHPTVRRLLRRVNIIAECYHNYKFLHQQYHIYKASHFALLKNATILQLSQKFIDNMDGVFLEGTVISPETSSIETAITLASNTLRRSIEFII